MKNIKYLVLFLSTLFLSCTKSAGTGGRATIKGNIVVDNINIQGNIVDSYDAQDHEVYIIYGQKFIEVIHNSMWIEYFLDSKTLNFKKEIYIKLEDEER